MKKTTKVELVSALALLIVAAVMMTSASFAWYTISRSADMQGVKVHMSAMNNVEIAMVSGSAIPSEVTTGDAGNPYAWGGTISFDDAVEVVLPATTSTDGICTVKYDSTGRTSGYAIANLSSADDDGIRYYRADIGYAYNNDEIDEDHVTIAAVFDVWLRTNTPSGSSLSATEAAMYVSYGSVDAYANDSYSLKLTDVKGKVAVFVGTKNVGTYFDIDEENDLDDPIDSGDVFNIPINTPVKVRIVTYIDGSTIFAKTANWGAYLKDVNVEFYNTEMNPL